MTRMKFLNYQSTMLLCKNIDNYSIIRDFFKAITIQHSDKPFKGYPQQRDKPYKVTNQTTVRHYSLVRRKPYKATNPIKGTNPISDMVCHLYRVLKCVYSLYRAGRTCLKKGLISSIHSTDTVPTYVFDMLAFIYSIWDIAIYIGYCAQLCLISMFLSRNMCV